MGVYRDQVLPRIVDLTLGTKDISHWRRRCVEGLSGVIVEPGFGSGLNLPWLPETVTKVYAIDPAALGQKLAAKRLEAAAIPVEFIGLDGQTIPLPDDSCDGALLTFTLCTIPDPALALAELRRVLRPGGRLHFLEHGHSPDPRVAAWQRRIEPAQKIVADGCHLTRNIAELITDAGFTIDHLEETSAGRPKAMSHFYLGVAGNP